MKLLYNKAARKMLVKLTPNQNFVIPFVDIGRKENSQELNELKIIVLFLQLYDKLSNHKNFYDLVNIEGDKKQKV